MNVNKVQKFFLDANKDNPTVLVGYSSLEHTGLIYGCGSFDVYTPFKNLDGVSNGSVLFEHYHFSDMSYLEETSKNFFIPTQERAIIDTIAWMEKYSRTGILIEAIQDYCDNHSDLSLLYQVAEHYNVNASEVDYWINKSK